MPHDALATGSVNVFQKIFFRRLSLGRGTSAVDFSETTTAPPMGSIDTRSRVGDRSSADGFVGRDTSPLTQDSTTPLLAGASSATSPGSSVPLDVLISQGARAFNEETFNGNGRTCATCHPASNNFTIDPAFIATLPAQDPLFVAEFNPALAELERPQLMRQFGLIPGKPRRLERSRIGSMACLTRSACRPVSIRIRVWGLAHLLR